MIGLLLFLLWMSLWATLCWVFYYMDQDYDYTRNILPNLPLEAASEEDIIEMVEDKLEEKKAERVSSYTGQGKARKKLYQFTARQLLVELAFRIRKH